MNKKGQALVMFIAILPVILIMLAFVVDVGLMYNAKIKGTNLLEKAIEEKKDIKEYFKINDIDIERIETKEEKCVIIEYRIDSVFGSIIGIKEYKIAANNCD